MALRGTASQPNSTSSTTCTVTVTGIGIQLGDIILFYAVGAGSGSATITFPTGFARPTGITNTTAGTTGNTFDMAYKVATSTEVAASTLAFTSNQNDFQTGHIRVYSGRNTTSPFTAVSQAATTTLTSPPVTFSVPTLTAAAGDDIVLVLGINNTAASDTISMSTVPTGFANAGGIHGAASFGQNAAFADYVNNAGGATGTITGAINCTSAGNMAYGAFVVSLAQASGNVVLACVQGAFSLTGEAAGLAVSKLPAVFGTFSLSGQAVTMSQGGAPLTLLAASGVFNYVGASSLTNFALDVAAGQFSLAGLSVTLGGSGVGLNLPVQQGGFNYQGFQVTFSLATVSAGTISANVGGFVLAGQPVNLTIANLPPSSSGVLGKPGGRTIFSAKKVSEQVNFIWDFISSLALGETILTNQITATTYMGNDTNPAGIVGGPAVVSGTQVFQLILGGLSGQIYGVSCSITTSTGQTLTESAYLAIEPDLP